jgi:hypothetical protein
MQLAGTTLVDGGDSNQLTHIKNTLTAEGIFIVKRYRVIAY